jgi:hypothetical protein
MPQTKFHSEHHRCLNILAGAWDTTITMIKGDSSDGEISRATDIYTWMPNGHFLVHEVDALMGDHHVQSTEIFGVDSELGGFFSRSYDPDGSTNDFVSKIDGLDYTIVGKVQRFAGHFNEDGSMLSGEWRQLVGDDWMPFVRIVLKKRS